MRSIAIFAGLALAAAALPAAAQPDCRTRDPGPVLTALASLLSGHQLRRCEAGPGPAETRAHAVAPRVSEVSRLVANGCRLEALPAYDARGQAIYQPARACSRG